MEWKFQRVETEFEQLPAGEYRIRIKSAEKAISKNGNDMLVLQFDVSGNTQTLYHYIPFLADKPEVTNRMLTQFFDSFGIAEDFNLASWIGKAGACKTKQDEEGRAKISYFLNKKQQEKLPQWKEPDGKKTGKLTPFEDDGDLPF